MNGQNLNLASFLEHSLTFILSVITTAPREEAKGKAAVFKTASDQNDPIIDAIEVSSVSSTASREEAETQVIVSETASDRSNHMVGALKVSSVCTKPKTIPSTYLLQSSAGRESRPPKGKDLVNPSLASLPTQAYSTQKPSFQKTRRDHSDHATVPVSNHDFSPMPRSNPLQKIDGYCKMTSSASPYQHPTSESAKRTPEGSGDDRNYRKVSSTLRNTALSSKPTQTGLNHPTCVPTSYNCRSNGSITPLRSNSTYHPREVFNPASTNDVCINTSSPSKIFSNISDSRQQPQLKASCDPCYTGNREVCKTSPWICCVCQMPQSADLSDTCRNCRHNRCRTCVLRKEQNSNSLSRSATVSNLVFQRHTRFKS